MQGTFATPLLFDPGKDFVIQFAPPEDEEGDPLTQLSYEIRIFYYDENGNLLNDIVDPSQTWRDPYPYFDPNRMAFLVPAGELELDDDGLHTFRMPLEVFPWLIFHEDSTSSLVEYFKVELAARCSSGNAAVTFIMKKSI